MTKKVIFISGNFNIIHPGHQRLFMYAKSLGDKLIVGVLNDHLAGEGAYISEDLRLESVKNNSIIDKAFLISDGVKEAILSLKPDYVVKGKEYEEKFNIEKKVVESYGGVLSFSSGETVFTSSELIKNEIFKSSKFVMKDDDAFLSRHKIDKSKLVELVDQFSKLKILVLGETIVDEYISCQALGMSQEDPTIAVYPLERNLYLGGAAIVASHASGLGANAKFISVIGDDHLSMFVKEKLEQNRVNANLLVDTTRPTSLKQRYRANGKTLLRVNHLHQNSISNNLQEEIIDNIRSDIDDLDLIVFSDFNYGVIPQLLLESFSKLTLNKKTLIVADSQSSSQIGNISRFKNMDLITPTEREARLGLQDHESGLVYLLDTLQTVSKAKNIILKMGEDGILINSANEQTGFKTDKVEALNPNPVDVSGAGDSMLISTSMALAAGANIFHAAYIGSLSASLQVSRIGNVPITIADFYNIV